MAIPFSLVTVPLMVVCACIEMHKIKSVSVSSDFIINKSVCFLIDLIHHSFCVGGWFKSEKHSPLPKLIYSEL